MVSRPKWNSASATEAKVSTGLVDAIAELDRDGLLLPRPTTSASENPPAILNTQFIANKSLKNAEKKKKRNGKYKAPFLAPSAEGVKVAPQDERTTKRT